MNSNYQNIVVPVDLGDKKSIELILPTALGFVNAFKSQLHFIYIIPDYGSKMVEDYLPKSWFKDQKAKYQNQVQELINKYIPVEIKVNLHISRGAVYDEVINYSNQIDADLILISAVRPQLKDYMLGPNTSKIVRHAKISVLVVR